MKKPSGIRKILLFAINILMLQGTCLVLTGTANASESANAAGASYASEPANASESCAIYIYMCGSNLESRHGFATQNINELLAADIPENTNVILETGGTSKWWSSQNIDSSALQRYTVRDGKLTLIENLHNANMGKQETFSDFLKWGTGAYPAERSILVIWDHGGSAADSVCYDENYGFDCLSREELAAAFEEAQLPKKFDLILFDTCYMAALETAALVQDYACYMTASQKIVPGGGLDYKALAESFEGNDDETLGRIICDSFMDKCRKMGEEEEAQLSFYDLSQTDFIARSLDVAAADAHLQYSVVGNTYSIFRMAMEAHIGDGSKDVNAIDLGNFIEAIFPESMLPAKQRFRQYQEAFICYQVKGEQAECTGVSVYYPFRYSKTNLEAYAQYCPSTLYGRLLVNIYSELPERTITFKDRGSIAEDGSYEITLSEDSARYLRGIICRIQRENEEEPGTYSLIMDGEVDTYDTDMERSDATLTVNSTFSGDAVALDGHLLMLTVVPRRFTATYSAPVNVNGEHIWYSFVRKKKDGVHSLVSVTLGNGTDEMGLPTRDIRHLQPGDRVCTYAAADERGRKLIRQEEFVIGEDGGTLSYMPLPPGTYRYQFIVTDIVGNKYGSDYSFFEIREENGERTVEISKIVRPGD